MSYAVTEQEHQQTSHAAVSSFHLQAHGLPRQADPIRGEPSRRTHMGPSGFQAQKPRIGHFDPDELRRRLHGVLAEQRAHAERKRARAAAAAAAAAAASSDGPALGPGTPLSSNPPHLRQQQPPHPQSYHPAGPAADDLTPGNSDYHHVPREAAKQFTRTATQEVMREQAQIHEFSKRAMKLHMDGRAARTPDGTTLPADIAARLRQSQDQSHSHRRNTLFPQYQQRRTGSDASATMMMNRNRNRQTMHMYEPPSPPYASNPWRRNSTGNDPPTDRAVVTVEAVDDNVSRSDDTTPPEEPVQRFPPEPRTDWTQSDELGKGNRSKFALPPLLKKADSFWGLRGRSKKDSDKVRAVTEGEKEKGPEEVSPTSAKSPKTKFFSKFIR
ncbi:hypothetical protein QBC34DRAFT_73529 [Podospora aff. communis PSN243]|uniref:Uncharacterized protein n=1 Tax=Podospora aff. communis PSN243 TaxID=3040156 RepID=A0AAV9H5J2_9PEZI|nr:hypothetical protein QBC34DRAFT_73529 [Podospora aff. communis PSN243]